MNTDKIIINISTEDGMLFHASAADNQIYPCIQCLSVSNFCFHKSHYFPYDIIEIVIGRKADQL